MLSRIAVALVAALPLCETAVAQAPAAAVPQSLAIQSATLQTREDGAAVEPGRLFRNGESAFGSFFVIGYTKKPSPDPGSEDSILLLSWRAEAIDPEGLAIQEPQTGKVDATIRREDKDWRPKIRFTLLVPPASPSGEYKFRLWVKDEFGQKETRLELPFQVRGYDAPKVDKLTVANFRFQKTDRVSERPMDDPVYRENEEVWVHFDAAGFQLGGKNKYDVAYSLAILDALGKVLFEQENAAELTETPAYPKHALPGALSIRVQPGTAKTTYQFRVRVTDRIGNTTAEHAGSFRVN